METSCVTIATLESILAHLDATAGDPGALDNARAAEAATLAATLRAECPKCEPTQPPPSGN